MPAAWARQRSSPKADLTRQLRARGPSKACPPGGLSWESLQGPSWASHPDTPRTTRAPGTA
eukprot:1255663-Pyramimonas_sp.AAC.1